jgi:DNA-binding SARP family transcriptional activator
MFQPGAFRVRFTRVVGGGCRRNKPKFMSSTPHFGVAPEAPYVAEAAVLREPAAVSELALIRLLGQPGVTLSGGIVHALSGKSAALVALAAIEHSPSCRRVAGMLWPDSPARLARNNLRTLRHRLSRQLGVEVLDSGEQLSISSQAAIQAFSADELVAELDAGGASSCRLLADVGLLELEQFQEWLSTAQQRVNQQQLAALEIALATAMGSGQRSRAIGFARACVVLEPLSERWHRRLMHTHTACGDRAAALAAYEACKETLLDNLGATPDDRTRGLHLNILKSQHSDGPTQEAAPAPVEAVQLIERDRQLERLELAFARGLPMVLHGEAGVGKTRLLKHFSHDKAVLAVTVRAGASQDPYSALAQVLLVAQQTHMLQLDRAYRIELARVAPQAFPDDEPSVASVSVTRLRDALRHWGEALRAKGVTLLSIDDLHYADARSQSAFAALIDLLPNASPPLPLILSYRRGEIAGDLNDAIGLQRQRHRLEEVQLDRLSREGIAALLRSLGRDEVTLQAHAEQLLLATGGNPLFVIELTLFAHLEQVDGQLGRVGTNLDLLLQTRLAGCSDTARQLAFTAGVAMADFSVELAACVMRRTAIDLMPAWSELQARGLFGENGLAHDLVRDAVLAALPSAIRVAMHRQVAGFLEEIGRVGASVVRHWLAAREFERALPHAAKQFEVLAYAGAETPFHRETILEILEQLDGQFLIEHVWLTTNLSPFDMSEATRARLETLIDRVEQIARSDEARGWVAFERSRLLLYGRGEPKLAHAVLSAAVATLRLSDPAALWIEVVLSVAANQLGKEPHRHARRAASIAARIPKDRAHHLLCVAACLVRSAFLLEHGACAREAATRMRSIRAAGDRGASREIRLRIAEICCLGGFPAAGARHYRYVAQTRGSNDQAEWVSARGFTYGRAALRSGRYLEAIRCLEPVLQSQTVVSLHARTVLAWGWAVLGRPDLANQHGDLADIGINVNFEIFVMNALLRSGLARRRGELGAAELQAAIDTMQGAGTSPVFVGMLETALANLVASPSERVKVATRGLRLVRPPHPNPGDVTSALLMLAEAHADAEPDGLLFRPFALEGAALARRGRIGGSDYQPDLLCRFARLLRRTDPDLAASLTHVAARWVRNACDHLPETARESFVDAHSVNTELLRNG